MIHNPALSYRDVYLVPRHSILKSRSEADISVEFLGRKFAAPWIPANMSSVINENIAHWLSENDYPYIMHRFGDNRAFIERANRENWKLISISVGVKETDKELLQWVVENKLRIDWITIDIACGDSILVEEMIRFIRGLKFELNLEWDGENFCDDSYTPKIIAGNVTTRKAVEDLYHIGADAVKIGVGGGGNCSTKNVTAFHIPMFTCASICSGHVGPIKYQGECCDQNIPLIIDGGIRESGDIARALVAGGGGNNLVMAGSLFGACLDAPSEPIGDEWGGIVKKKMWGSASARQKGEKKNVEGFISEIPCNGMTYKELYQSLRESLQSSVSYGGGKDLSCFKDVEWVVVK